jgi:hypothetical protein
MPGQISIHIDKGMMPRSGVLHRPLWILFDNAVLGDIGWGHTKTFEIPPGKHSIALQNKRSKTAFTALEFEAINGESTNINCLMDTAGRLHIVNSKDKGPIKIEPIQYDERAQADVMQNKKHHAAVGVLYFIGCITLLAGLITQFTSLNLYDKSAVPYLLISGLVFFVLGFLVWKKSFVALLLAIILYGWDTVSLILLLLQGYRLAIGGIVMHVILMIALLKGIKAIWAFNQKKVYGSKSAEPAVRTCSRCGAILPLGVNFCNSCNTPAEVSVQYQPEIVKKGYMLRYKLLGAILGILIVLTAFLFAARSFR